MATTQDGRLLSIATPLGKDFLLINKLSATEEISKLFSFEVELLHEENEAGTEPTIVDVQALLGQSVTITVEQKQTDRSADAKRTFSGMISRFSQGMRHTRFTSYTATIVPHAWIMTQNSQSRIFQHKTVPEILKKVFEEYKIHVGFELQGTFKARNYCVQYRESDFEFVSRLMEEEGIYYFFEHADGKHKMIIANTPQSHRDCPSKSDIPYFIEIPGEYYAPSIHGWNVNYQLLTGKVTLWDYNFQLPTQKLDGEQPSRYNIGGNQELEFYDFPGGYARKYDDIDRTGGERSDLTNVFPDKQKTAEIAMQAFDAKHKTASGVGDCSSMTAGHRFKLINHPNRALNGQYIITSITHEAVQNPTYISGDEVDQAYTNSFTCLSHGAGAPPFRPLKTTPKPTVRGSQTATVVGPAGEEIFTDKFGRVKVQLHWDRELRFDPDSSCWLRVATSIAGKKWGTMFIPRIGQEVMVDFLEGDPDQPIIVGSVYNPETMPHYELPKYKTLSYFKSRTSPDDGKGFNELRFEDKQGKEQVFIHSQKRMDVRVRGSYYETCGGNRQELIGVRTDNKPGGNLAITVGGNYDLHVKDSMYIGIDKKLNETVKGEVVEDYQSSLATMVKTKAELNAMEIIMEAKMKISLKVGGSCIIIDPTGITIAGKLTKINSGGFGTETGNPSIDDPLDAEAADTGQPGYLERPRSGGGPRTRNRRQLNSQHYIAPPRPGEDARITAMRNLLQNSAQGRHALEVYDRYDVQPSFRAGEGSTFDPNNNNMNINPTQTPERQALGFVHEMNHGEAHHEGTAADIQNQNRNDYVNTQLNEETEGVIRSIEARNELINSGHNEVQPTQYPLQNEYQTAYDQAVANARAANPNISDADADAAGRQAGRDRVRQGFNDGEVVPSNNTAANPNRTYPQYYGEAWDRAHPAP